MARIRSLKPEWLEDEKLAACDDSVRLLSAGLILLADDQGRGRANLPYIASQVWTYHPRESLAKASRALAKLSELQFVILYGVNGEQFYQIRTWDKHQKVDHPAKPRIPGPELATSRESREVIAKVRESLAPDPDPDPDPDLKEKTPSESKRNGVTPLKPKPQRRVPEEFDLTPERQLFATGLGLTVREAEMQFDAMCDFEFGRPYSDWDAVWRNWVRRHVTSRPTQIQRR